MTDLTAIFTAADRLRAYFRERGWTIVMEDNGRSVIDPFAAIIEAVAVAIDPEHCVCGAQPSDPGCAAHGGYRP